MFWRRKKSIRVRRATRTSSAFFMQVTKGVLGLALIAFLLYGVHYLTRLNTFTLQHIVIEGGETITHEDVRTRVEDTLTGNYWGLVPKRFMFTYPKEAIRTSLGEITRIRDITLTRRDNTLHVTFSEYTPHALWCVYERADVPCYFLSEDGFAFAEAPSLFGGSFLRHYTESEESLTRGQVIDTETLAEIEWLAEAMERELGFRIATVLHRENGDVELTAHGGGTFLITSGKDIHQTFENLRSVLTSDVYDHLAPGNFRYVDARFDTKIFVNEELVPDSEESTASTSQTGAEEVLETE